MGTAASIGGEGRLGSSEKKRRDETRPKFGLGTGETTLELSRQAPTAPQEYLQSDHSPPSPHFRDHSMTSEKPQTEGDNMTLVVTNSNGLDNSNDAPDADGGLSIAKVDTAAHDPYSRYLKSSMVEVIVGAGDAAESIHVHKLFLEQSPYFKQKFASDTGTYDKVELPDEDPEAMQSLVEYLYTKEYFPHRIYKEGDPVGELQQDPSIPAVDENGDELLKHARIYLLADKFELKELKELAFAKIHLVESMPLAEIVYARFVYKNTPDDNQEMREPVATFWASKSHIVRHNAMDEFRSMCLEYPQFGFDVLNLVLNQKEKGRSKEHSQRAMREDSSVRGSARKRPRHSDI